MIFPSNMIVLFSQKHNYIKYQQQHNINILGMKYLLSNKIINK